MVVNMLGVDLMLSYVILVGVKNIIFIVIWQNI